MADRAANDNGRFVVRRRAPDDWAVVDSEHAQLDQRGFTTEDAAAKEAARLNDLMENGRTYGVTWYCEVDAVSPDAAVAEARKFLAPSYRENWEPTSVEAIEP